jgi:hypothetical protein
MCDRSLTMKIETYIYKLKKIIRCSKAILTLTARICHVELHAKQKSTTFFLSIRFPPHSSSSHFLAVRTSQNTLLMLVFFFFFG